MIPRTPLLQRGREGEGTGSDRMAAATSRHLTRTRVLRSRMLLTSKPQIVERDRVSVHFCHWPVARKESLFCWGNQNLSFRIRVPLPLPRKCGPSYSRERKASESDGGHEGSSSFGVGIRTDRIERYAEIAAAAVHLLPSLDPRQVKAAARRAPNTSRDGRQPAA